MQYVVTDGQRSSGWRVVRVGWASGSALAGSFGRALGWTLAVFLGLAVSRAGAQEASDGAQVALPAGALGEAEATAADDIWTLFLLAGKAFDRGHEAVSPNGAAVGIELVNQNDGQAFFLGGEARFFFGESRDNIDGRDVSRMRFRVGPTAGIQGFIGDFDARLSLAFGPLFEVGASAAKDAELRVRWYLSPGLTIDRALGDSVLLGAQLRYTAVFQEVDALSLLLALGVRWGA